MSDVVEIDNVRKPDGELLYAVASEQSGYFTSKQAAERGYSAALLSHHAKSGRFRRERRGLYRLKAYPSSPREQVLAAWLAVGRESAIVSHVSALDILELGDVIPDAVHITVPRTKRNLPKIRGVKIHTTVRPPTGDESTVRDGMAVTSAARSIVDAAAAGLSPEQVERAVSQALQRGLTTIRRLEQAVSGRGIRVSSLVLAAIEKTQS